MISDASKTFLIEYEKVLHKNVGQKGLEFTYNDINDKPVSFSDFKGKFVYIDLWATWC
ncbi:thiol-disulfide oxidoreductase [compost metagenome]